MNIPIYKTYNMKKFDVKTIVAKGEYISVNNVFDNKIHTKNVQEMNIL